MRCSYSFTTLWPSTSKKGADAATALARRHASFCLLGHNCCCFTANICAVPPTRATALLMVRKHLTSVHHTPHSWTLSPRRRARLGRLWASLLRLRAMLLRLGALWGRLWALRSRRRAPWMCRWARWLRRWVQGLRLRVRWWTGWQRLCARWLGV